MDKNENDNLSNLCAISQSEPAAPVTKQQNTMPQNPRKENLQLLNAWDSEINNCMLTKTMWHHNSIAIMYGGID